MKLGILSDTHTDKMHAIPHIVAEFKKRGVSQIIHCGDIIPEHLNGKLFGNFPVICALTEGQPESYEFARPPDGWVFTKPNDRIVAINQHSKIYVGHKRSYEFLRGTESDVMGTLERIRRDYDNVRMVLAGHTHHQLYKQSPLISFLNPGAVEDSYWGYEFAIADTENESVTFSRILPNQPTKETFRIGVISDSRNISELNPSFWERLTEKLRSNGVKILIHCGNITSSDIGRKELNGFEVWFNLRPDQTSPKDIPGNWHLINLENPVVKIEGYRFCVQHQLGGEMLSKSEIDMYKLSLKLATSYPAIEYILFGLTHEAFLHENEQVHIINPGDAVKDQSFCIIELPRNEITFSCIPNEPLPKI